MKNRMMRITLVAEVLALIVWLVFVVLLSKDIYGTARFSVTLFCGVIAFAAAIGILFYLSGKSNRALTEVHAIPVYFSAVYLLVVFIINSVFLVKVAEIQLRIQIIINVTLLASFLILCIGAGEYYHRADRQVGRVVEKTWHPGIISGKLGELLALPVDQDTKTRLLALKEHVDFSGNMTQVHTMEYQDKMEQTLVRIESSIRANEGEDTLNALIDQAEQIWGARNSADTTMR